MKNKNIIILTASLVLSLGMAGAVTGLAKGGEEKSVMSWVQRAQDAGVTVNKSLPIPVTAPSAPTKPVEAVEKPAKVSKPVTGEKREGISAAAQEDLKKQEAEKKSPAVATQKEEESAKDKEILAPEVVVPEAAFQKPAPSTLAPVPQTAPVSETAPFNTEPAQPAPVEEASKEDPTAPTPATVNKGTILQMTTTAENSTTALQFNYAENFGDGRGITFGIIGFTTGTHDGNELIKHYTTLNGNNSLARFIPALDGIDQLPHTGNDGDSADSTAGLDGFIQAVQGNTDPLFRQAQLDKLDQLYWNPAVKLLDSIGAKNPLTQAFLYDMMVNHGQNGAQNFISKATYALGGTPGTGIDENTYLSKLMDLRETHLNNTGNPGADRVAAFRRILDTGNVRLLTPFPFTVYGDTFRIDGDIQ